MPATPMITIREARAAVLAAAREGRRTERVAVTAASGRVLAAAVAADSDLPPFDRVMMDGYALRAADVAPGAPLPVAGEVAAGDSARAALPPRTALAIMTGAPLPPGADAVAPIEWCTLREGRVSVDRALRPGQHVAPQGEDLRAGAEVAAAGSEVTPYSLSLLIAAGVAEVTVYRCPRLALLTSGNELVPPGTPLRRGQIRESNGHALAALLAGTGARMSAPVVARDTRADMSACLQRAWEADVIVLTGGSSVGKYDFSAEVIAATGARPVFDRISVKPGKPTLFSRAGDKLILALPGNPVAALMTGRVLVAAALAARAGHDVSDWTAVARPLRSAVARVAERDLLVPMARDGDGLVFAGWHGSGDLVSLAAAEGFGFVERGRGQAEPGTPADWFGPVAETGY